MQSDLFYCRITLHVTGVTAPIIRSTKNCNRNFRYRSQYRYSYFPPWPDLVGYYLILNYDARNHKPKINIRVTMLDYFGKL